MGYYRYNIERTDRWLGNNIDVDTEIYCEIDS